jgi:hypothetical protein
MSDKNYARCDACNTSIYPAWVADRGEFEFLCGTCLGVARRAAKCDAVIYGSGEESTLVNHEKWYAHSERQDKLMDLGANDEESYLRGMMSDKAGQVSGDMLADDEYFEGVTQGEWFGGNNPFEERV